MQLCDTFSNRCDPDCHMRSLLLGGDQMTCKLIRSAHNSRSDGNSAEERLEGLLSMVEDFHEKMTFLQVNIKIVDEIYVHC